MIEFRPTRDSGDILLRRAVPATLRFVLFGLLLLLASASTASAQSTDCEMYEDGGDRLKCKHDKMLEQQERLVGNVKTDYSDALTEEELDRMERTHGRSKRTGDRMKPKHFKAMAKKHDLICELKEWEFGNPPPNGDGICTGKEQCEEVIGDQIGDETQPCITKGKKKEVCVEICGEAAEQDDTMLYRTGALHRRLMLDAAPPDDDDNDRTDPELVADLEESFDDIAGQMADLNDLMEEKAPEFRVVMANLRAAQDASDVCKYSADWQSVVIPILGGAKTLNALIRGAADVAERFCDQVAPPGISASTLCALVEGGAGVAALVVEGFEGVVAGLQANLQDDTGACLEDVSGNLGSIKTTVEASAGDTAALVTAMTEHRTDLTNHDTAMQAMLMAMAAALAELRAEQAVAFQLEIESLLSTSECPPTLWLPAAQGGRLEEVRDHVALQLGRAIDSGDPAPNIGAAGNHLGEADGFIVSGEYMKACQRLALALKAIK